MNKIISFALVACLGVAMSADVYAKKFEDAVTPEETGLNVQKITDESSNTVYGHEVETGLLSKFKSGSIGGLLKGKKKGSSSNMSLSQSGCCDAVGMKWWTGRVLTLSPDGTELAYLSEMNRSYNIMIRKATAVSTSTQRTFRAVNSFSWAVDNKLYYGDYTNSGESAISQVNADKGNVTRQLTNGNYDRDPVLAKDGKTLFFTREDKSGPSIWSINLQTGDVICCARGYNIALIGDKTDEFLCVRNSTSGNSEIWLVNYVQGQETLILSDRERGFTNPMLSPDGQWILVEGNSKSAISKKQNLDIFAVKLDGSNLVQLTYHPGNDCCPVWSADGKSVFFISDRTNKKGAYNVWKMRFEL